MMSEREGGLVGWVGGFAFGVIDTFSCVAIPLGTGWDVTVADCMNGDSLDQPLE
jgi:hypothetical protein